MEVLVDIGRFGDRAAEPHHELGLGEVLGRELVHDLRHDAGAVVEPVAQLGVAMNEDALPRHQHVIEYDHRVGLVEARREWIIHHRSGVLVDHRRATDEPQPRRVDRNAEAERVGLRLLAVGEVGRGQHQQIVRVGAQGGHHAGTANDDAGIGFLDDFRREILVLLLDRPRAVDLRIDQSMCKADVVFADPGMIGADILGKAAVVLTELLGRRGEAGEEDVHEIGAAPEHAASRIHPDLHHVAATDQIFDRARLDEG